MLKAVSSSRFRRLAAAVAAAAVVALAAGEMRAQETLAPAPTPTPTAGPFAKPRYAALENELALYSPFESPWAEIKVNHAFETHLFGLMRAEVRLWDLQSQLAAPEGNPARESAAEISRIVHEQILAEVVEALPMLQKTPNKAFAQLLVHQLEAYPYEWREEGSEELLPSLRKLADPTSGKLDSPGNGGGRRRRRGNG